MFCSDCGALMVGECGRSRNGKVYHYYKCSSVKKKTGNCSRHSLRKDEIEEFVISQTVNTVFDDSMMNIIADKVFEYQKQENTVIPLLRRELAETEKSIGNFVKAIEMGIFTESTQKRLSELESRKEELFAKIAREEIRTSFLSREQIMLWLKKMKDLDILNTDNRERIIDTFINSIYVFDDKIIINYNCREECDKILPGEKGICSDIWTNGEPK